MKESEDEDDQVKHIEPPFGREAFFEWRSPRLGTANPERMNNPVWEWLVRSKESAWAINEHFEGKDAFESGPGWCFDRFGQSSTELADGRIVLIAGEHEDHYDSDFYIYSDVVVLHPDGHVDIFGYPRDVFPPTDFHTATHVEDQIVIIGCLGYADERRPGQTQIRALDLKTFAVSVIKSSGDQPGWIHDHKAIIVGDGAAIIISGGLLQTRGDKVPFVENVDDWRLDLADWSWQRLTKRPWQQWEINRADGEAGNLQMVRLQSMSGALSDGLDDLMPAFGFEVVGKGEVSIYATLYEPEIGHTKMAEEEDESGITRIGVDGVVVRYVEGLSSIRLVVEGVLPRSTIDLLVGDVREKLSRIENSPCEAVRIDL